MAAKKKKRKPTTRSGPNIRDDQRHTRKITVRVAPETDERWRRLARQQGLTLSEVATKGIDLLGAQKTKGGSR
jgi:hypothetical protein